MKYTTQLAAFAAATSAQQFVQVSSANAAAAQRADPIISPGDLSGHVHEFFGASRLAAELSYESLQKSDCSTVGSSDDGSGNAQDKSVYWHPAMYVKKKGGSEYMKVPVKGHKLYYKNAGSSPPREPFEFPHGFRMVAGDPFMRGPASLDSGRQNITQWICHSSSGMNQGTDGGFPTGVTDCDAYPGFNGAIHFPHCWNNDTDFTKGTHMAYPVDDIEGGECPTSHPIRLPHIFLENEFDINGVKDEIDISSLTLAMGDPTGYGWHADFFNGWDDGAIPELMDSCKQVNYDIIDCPSYQRFAKKNNECSQPVIFKENVQNPGETLPGCNPIGKTNPAPKYPTSPMNQFTDQCKAGAASPANPPVEPAENEPASPPQTSAASPYKPAPTQQTTTMATNTRPAAPASKPTTSIPIKHAASTQPNNQGNKAALSCPASHGQKTVQNGKTFEIECGIDHAAGNLKRVTAHSLSECIVACAKTKGCVDVSLSGTACYLKKVLGKEIEMKGLAGAKLVTGGGAPAGYGKAKREEHVHRHVHGREMF